MERNETLDDYLERATNAFHAMGLAMNSIENSAIQDYLDGKITHEQLQVLRGMIDYYMGRPFSNK